MLLSIQPPGLLKAIYILLPGRTRYVEQHAIITKPWRITLIRPCLFTIPRWCEAPGGM